MLNDAMNWRLCKSLRHMSTVISAEVISMTKDQRNKRFLLFLRGGFEATRQTTKKTARVRLEAALKNGGVWRMYKQRLSTKRQERIWPVRKHLHNPWYSIAQHSVVLSCSLPLMTADLMK